MTVPILDKCLVDESPPSTENSTQIKTPWNEISSIKSSYKLILCHLLHNYQLNFSKSIQLCKKITTILRNRDYCVRFKIVSAFEWWFFFVACLQQLQTLFCVILEFRSGQGSRTSGTVPLSKPNHRNIIYFIFRIFIPWNVYWECNSNSNQEPVIKKKYL